MAVSLVHNLGAVDGRGAAPWRELGGIEAEALRAPLLFHTTLVRGEVDHWILGEHVELRGVRIAGAQRLSCEINHCDLQAEAEAKVWDALRARHVCCTDLPFNAAVAVAAWHQDAVHASEFCGENGGLGIIKSLSVHPTDAHINAVCPAGVAQRFGDREVGIRKFGVLADDGDLNRRLLGNDLRGELLPTRKVWGSGWKTKLAHDQVAKAELFKLQRHLIDGARGGCGNDRLNRDVGEEGDLLTHVIGNWMVGAQDDDVGLNAAAAQLLHRVLGGLRLQLTGGGEFWKQRDVDVERVATANILLQLSNCLNERQ